MNEYKISDLKIGLKEEFDVKVTENMMLQFLNISGDNNPLHINKAYAIEKGYSDVVVYGMLTSSFYSTLVGVYLPGKYCLLQSIDIKFTNPVMVGDELQVVGEVYEIHEELNMFRIKACIINKNTAKKISKATIQIGILKNE